MYTYYIHVSGIGKDLYEKKVSKRKKRKQQQQLRMHYLFFLQDKNGDHFTAASFSAHLRSVLHGLTGKLASINILRSSFITCAYDKS